MTRKEFEALVFDTYNRKIGHEGDDKIDVVHCNNYNSTLLTIYGILKENGNEVYQNDE